MEFDVAAGYRSVQDVDAMISKMEATFASVPEPRRVVMVANWSACQLFAPEVGERAVRMLLRGNTRAERSAIFHQSSQPTSVLQVFRLIKEADAPFRRVFTEVGPLCEWLDEVLDAAERARLRTFLQGSEHAARKSAPAALKPRARSAEAHVTGKSTPRLGEPTLTLLKDARDVVLAAAYVTVMRAVWGVGRVRNDHGYVMPKPARPRPSARPVQLHQSEAA